MLLIVIVQLKVPYGSTVKADFKSNSNPFYLNIQVELLDRNGANGLCGSPDGDPTNEWLERNTGLLWPIIGSKIPSTVYQSWW
jgi:hypothetical protein